LGVGADVGLCRHGALAGADASRWRLIAAIALAAALLAGLLSLGQSDGYTASADLRFGRTTNADAIIAGGTTDTGEIPERAAATNLARASLDTVAARVARQFLGVTAGELKDSVEAAGDSDVVTVTAERPSPRQAAAVSNGFAAAIAAFQVVEAAPPDHRSSPPPLRSMLIAALAALILGVFVAVLLARFDDRIRDDES
jgi:capsular polysaccharide biosynthesis protein